MQLSSYALKMNSDLEECLGCSVLLERHIHADIIFNKVYVYFMTKSFPGRCKDIWLIFNRRCHVWVVFIVPLSLVKCLGAKPLTSVFSFHSDIWHDCSSHVKELPWRILLMKRLDSATKVIWYESQSGTFNSGLFKRNHTITADF